MYGYGLQTWEYSAAFALRSWWYLLLHKAIAVPGALLLGDERGKLAVFYLIRTTLCSVSAVSEWMLYRAVHQRYSSVLSNTFLAFLLFSSGMFAASSALLPSSFTMFALTAAAASVIGDSISSTIFSAVIGVMWGWCVTAVAFVPYALWVLRTARMLPAFGILGFAVMITLAPLVVADRVFYGSWKASLWNFLLYNVGGGGKSALYGVEKSTFYIRNGLNQLQFVLPLSLMLPALALMACSVKVSATSSSGMKSSRYVDGRLLLAVSPFFVWLLAISALPHKEERFLFVVYPLACLAAAATLDIIARASRSVLPSNKTSIRVSNVAMATIVGATALLSLSRTAALTLHYGAPISIYRALPAVTTATQSAPQQINVCVGAEWYRFPSSFFLPGPNYRLKFITSGFQGLLPRAFDPHTGGTRAAPLQLNDVNRKEPENVWDSSDQCHYAVTVKERNGWIDGEVLGGEDDWETMVEVPFLDAATSPALTRAFYAPYISNAKNNWLHYVLLRRRH